MDNDLNHGEEIQGGKMTIARWHEEALQGRNLPLHIPIKGVSMFPLIRYMKDYVTIVPLKEKPVIGDIVLFHDSIGKRYVLHRLIETYGETYVTRGDNCLGPDRPMKLDDIWGKAVLIERGRREIRPDARKGLRHARAWYRCGKVYRLGMRILRGAARRILGRRSVR